MNIVAESNSLTYANALQWCIVEDTKPSGFIGIVTETQREFDSLSAQVETRGYC